MYTKKITYCKEFLSGLLKGMTVRETVNTTDDAVHMRLAVLGQMQKDYVLHGMPAKDICGDWFRIYNIGCEDITPAETPAPAAEVA